MLLKRITDENDLKDGRIYLCCRSSRHGNALWETMEARKQRLLNPVGGPSYPMKNYSRVFDLPRRVADIAATDSK